MQKLIKGTSNLTNSFTYNFQLISIIYYIFSNEQPGHLFRNWPLVRAAFSRARLIEGVTYSRKKQKEKQTGKLKKTNQKLENRDIFKIFELSVEEN